MSPCTAKLNAYKGKRFAKWVFSALGGYGIAILLIEESRIQGETTELIREDGAEGSCA